jgi:hypothetical protein
MQLKRRKRLIGYNGREETSDWPQLSEEVQVNPGGSLAENVLRAFISQKVLRFSRLPLYK